MERPFDFDNDYANETKDEYSFSYHSTIHDRSLSLDFKLKESAQYTEVVEQFFDFLSAIYGYQITAEKLTTKTNK